MLATQLEHIKQQIQQLSDQDRSALYQFMNQFVQDNQPASQQANHSTAQTEVQAKVQAKIQTRRQKRQVWIDANRAQYGGQYIALDGDRLLGTGKTYPEAFKAAKKAGVADAFVDYLPAPDEVGYMSGWL